MSNGLLPVLVSLLAVTCTLILGLRNYKLQVQNALFEAALKLNQAYKEEIARLQECVRAEREKALQARHELEVCRQHLAEEREIFARELAQARDAPDSHPTGS